MSTVIVGLIFLLTGAFVYTFNQESHGTKLVFAVEYDHKVYGVGELETAVILLALGIFFLMLGAWKWLRNNKIEGELEGSGGPE